jgi:hypothetical protein
MNDPWNQQHPEQPRTNQPPEPPTRHTDPATNPMAFGDPSRREPNAQDDNDKGTGKGGERRRVMWVRPSELPTYLTGSELMVQGVDLHAALVRRMLRGPAKATEAVRRQLDPKASARRTSRSGGHEGVSL